MLKVYLLFLCGLCLYKIYMLVILKNINIDMDVVIFCKISYRYRIKIEILISKVMVCSL